MYYTLHMQYIIHAHVIYMDMLYMQYIIHAHVIYMDMLYMQYIQCTCSTKLILKSYSASLTQKSVSITITKVTTCIIHNFLYTPWQHKLGMLIY